MLRLLALILLTTLISGCALDEKSRKPVNAAADPWQGTIEPQESTPSQRVSASTVKLTGFTDVGSEERVNLPPSRELKLQINHENGTQLQVSGIQFQDALIAVDVVAINGTGESIKLNSFGKELMLVDSLGNKYMAVPPAANREFNIPPNQALEASLHFAGRIHPEASSLTLITNDRSGEPDSRSTTRPKISVPIALTEL